MLVCEGVIDNLPMGYSYPVIQPHGNQMDYATGQAHDNPVAFDTGQLHIDPMAYATSNCHMVNGANPAPANFHPM